MTFKNNPYSRRMLTNIYVHQDLSEMNLYPCAYSMTFNVTGDRLNAILNQRSRMCLRPTTGMLSSMRYWYICLPRSRALSRENWYM